MGEHDRIATTGFSKMSDRQIGLWDTGSLSNVKTTMIDQSSGVLMPFWSDNNILFVGTCHLPHMVGVYSYDDFQPARGNSSRLLHPLQNSPCSCSDGNIRYFEYENDVLHPLAEHKSTDPQRGMCFLPRRALNVAECEIARAYKLSANSVEPIAFIVPRKVSYQLDQRSAVH